MPFDEVYLTEYAENIGIYYLEIILNTLLHYI